MSETHTETTDTTVTETQAAETASAVTEAVKSAADFSITGDMFPEDLSAEPTIKELEGKTLLDLAKMHLNAQKKMGGERLNIPGKDAADEEWANVYNALGRPKDPAEYGIKTDDVFESIGIGEDVLNGFAATAHQNGLNAKQVNGVLDFYKKVSLSQKEAIDAEVEARNAGWMDQVQAEFANALDQKRNIASALLANTDGGEEVRKVVHEAGLANSPVIFKWLLGIASKVGEDHLQGLDAMNKSNNTALSPDEAKKEIAAIDADPIMTDRPKTDPERIRLVEKRQKLILDAFPSTPD